MGRSQSHLLGYFVFSSFCNSAAHGEARAWDARGAAWRTGLGPGQKSQADPGSCRARCGAPTIPFLETCAPRDLQSSSPAEAPRQTLLADLRPGGVSRKIPRGTHCPARDTKLLQGGGPGPTLASILCVNSLSLTVLRRGGLGLAGWGLQLRASAWSLAAWARCGLSHRRLWGS